MYFSFDTEKNQNCIDCGKLEANYFCHMSRTLDCHVLIVVHDGVLNIEIDGQKHKVYPGEYIILPADVFHKGFYDEGSQLPINYLWVHIGKDELKICEGELASGINYKTAVIPQKKRLSNFARLWILFQQLADIFRSAYLDKNYCNHMLTALLCEIAWQTAHENLFENKLVNNSVTWINKHITEFISLDTVADAVGYDKKYLGRVFKRFTGRTVNEFIANRKIEYAKYYLANSSIKITEISERLGFHDVSYFMKYFKKYAGVTCGEYRIAFTKLKKN